DDHGARPGGASRARGEQRELAPGCGARAASRAGARFGQRVDLGRGGGEPSEDPLTSARERVEQTRDPERAEGQKARRRGGEDSVRLRLAVLGIDLAEAVTGSERAGVAAVAKHLGAA